MDFSLMVKLTFTTCWFWKRIHRRQFVTDGVCAIGEWVFLVIDGMIFVKWRNFSYSFQKGCIAWQKVILSFTRNHFVYLSFANSLYRLFLNEFVISPRLWRMIELNSVAYQSSFMWFLTTCSIIRIVCSFHCLVSICPFMATAISSLSELPLPRTATICPDPECPNFSSSSSRFISESSLSSFPLPLASLAGYCIAETLKND